MQNLQVQQVAPHARRTGNTTWLLKAALISPKCAIVFPDKKQAVYAQKHFLEISNGVELSYMPHFVSISEAHQEMHYYVENQIPVIFDNSTLFFEHKDTK